HEAVFNWHGGEATMLPLAFYEKAVELQQRYGAGMTILNCLQTNGTLLTDQWCRFLRRHGWLVGLSVDGPEEFHDEYRRMRTGQPSFERVMRGIRLLQRHGVDWNAMAVVNDFNAGYPVEFYEFFKELGCRYIQFAPIVERITADGSLATVGQQGRLAEFSVSPEQWGEFLCGVFDRWVRHDVGRVFVQIFDATLANWMGAAPGVCTLSDTCGHAGVIEHNGDVYSCDHFVFPGYRLGNIHSHTLVEMMLSERQMQFGRMKTGSLADECRRCDYLFACHGECPKNRFALAPGGDPRHNYLCRGYRRFFEHVAPYMDYMCQALKSGRPASDVMNFRR
ncbi:MAG: anaerobic sulfatase-maturation protein, partial [Muribaculaceae bacterium]|nr:anaerobic sulfatase-maturation protein [Muribaculaceae bacterium]